MPGAGGGRAATHLYKLAPKDGTTIGTFLSGNIINPLLGQSTNDATHYNWVGSVTDDVNVCMSWHASRIRTWADMQKEAFTVAGQGPGAVSNVYPNLVKNLFGAPIRLVSGYPGSNEMGMAMERREVDGICVTSWGSVITAYREMFRSKQLNFLFQAGFRKVPELPDVPMLLDLARNDQERATVRFVVGILGASRPFAAPPGVPEDRVRLLRDAFMKTMKDPEFLADAGKLDMEVNPLDGASVNALVDDLYRTPRDVLERAKQFFVQ
jgi:tripartite-type tricarboxylate transporter receptor subunit TctC